MANITFTLGNHRYDIVQQALTWDAAAANARSLGGHLLSIGSAQENAAVFEVAATVLKNSVVPVSYDGGDAAYLWMGGSDKGHEGDWRWEDGSAFGYNNWGHGRFGQEPDNYTDPSLAPDGQNGVGLALESWPHNLGGLGTAGQWNDISQNSRLWSVIEYNTPNFASNGTAAADTLTANPLGNNSIDGGAGLDTVLVQYQAAGYAVRKDASGVHLTGNDSNLDLSNVERVRFSDGALAFDTDGNAGQAYRLYQAAFDRKPDAGGLGYWIDLLDRGVKLIDVAQGFVSSQEFAYLSGSNLSHEQFITAMYHNVLHRAPDPGGMAFWMNSMAVGATQANLLYDFSESAENQGQVAAAIGQGFAYTPVL